MLCNTMLDVSVAILKSENVENRRTGIRSDDIAGTMPFLC